MLLVQPDSAVFVTDGRYGEQSRTQLDAAGVVATVEIRTTVGEQRAVLAAAAIGATRVGLEDHGVTWAQQRELADAIADDAFAALLPRFAEGPTEREFALALEFAMRERGASHMSFDPIIAAGPNGAMPHSRPSDRPIGRNELIVCDFGCVVDGYCSDMTRTVSVGDPGPDARRLYDLVLVSQQAGRDAVAFGVECREVDRVCRDVISDAGYGEAFSHGTGHGVGLEIHEAPRVATAAAGTLLVGDVVTVEPGVYLPGIGGVRIEDTLVVGSTGAEALTLTPKDLVL